jgi:hypothetical protein
VKPCHEILLKPYKPSVETAAIGGERKRGGGKAKERYRPHFISDGRATFAL